MPNGSTTNPAQHIPKVDSVTFTQKTLNQGTGSLDVAKVLIQN